MAEQDSIAGFLGTGDDDYGDAGPEAGPVVTASFTSPCEGCFNDIEPGDDIRAVEGEWFHDDCAREAVGG